jgi:hypothetical protein
MLHVQLPLFFFLGALCYLFPWIPKALLSAYIALLITNMARRI